MQKNFNDLEGKTVIVTGGNRGIGQEIAIDFAQLGANVIVIARDKDSLDKTLDILNESSGQHTDYALDMTQIDQLSKVIDDIISIYEKIDVLVNNAGINISKTAFEIEENDWENVL
ncbi:MAG: SDR family oxidoreductase, partial [Staphylococcus equorum]|nr:SDR family oxidoreductase [Staphylococcus equorum]